MEVCEDSADLFPSLKQFLLNSAELKVFLEAWLKLDPEIFDSSGLANILRRNFPFLLNLGSVLAVLILSGIVWGSSGLWSMKVIVLLRGLNDL